MSISDILWVDDVSHSLQSSLNVLWCVMYYEHWLLCFKLHRKNETWQWEMYYLKTTRRILNIFLLFRSSSSLSWPHFGVATVSFCCFSVKIRFGDSLYTMCFDPLWMIDAIQNLDNDNVRRIITNDMRKQKYKLPVDLF